MLYNLIDVFHCITLQFYSFSSILTYNINTYREKVQVTEGYCSHCQESPPEGGVAWEPWLTLARERCSGIEPQPRSCSSCLPSMLCASQRAGVTRWLEVQTRLRCHGLMEFSSPWDGGMVVTSKLLGMCSDIYFKQCDLLQFIHEVWLWWWLFVLLYLHSNEKYMLTHFHNFQTSRDIDFAAVHLYISVSQLQYNNSHKPHVSRRRWWVLNIRFKKYTSSKHNIHQ